MRRVQIFGLMLLPYVVFGIIRVIYGLLVGDEGWYLLAIQNVMNGKKPYADFLYTQTPFLPYFYGTLMSVLGTSLIAGRWISFALGFGAVLLTMMTAHRKAGLHGAVVAGLLLSFNLAFVFDTGTLKSQALTVFLVAASVYFLPDRGGAAWKAMLCMVFMTLALATRLSMAPVLLLLFIYLVMQCREKLLLISVAIVLDLLLIAAATRYFYSDGNLLFGIYTFHHEYFGERRWSLEQFWSFIQETASNQVPLLVCTIWAALICVAKRNNNVKLLAALKHGDHFLLFLACSYVITTLAHAVQIMPYATYQVSNIIFPVLFCSIVLGKFVSNLPSVVWGYAVLIPLVLVGIPPQEYRIDWTGNASLGGVKQLVDFIQERSGGKGPILTLETELAAESGLPLLPGYEMGEFGYFARMSSERAEKLKVVNLEKFGMDIESKAANVICITDRDYEILLSPKDQEALGPILGERYKAVGQIDGYGQFRQRLYVFIAK